MVRYDEEGSANTKLLTYQHCWFSDWHKRSWTVFVSMHFLPRQTDIIGENVSLNEACELHICLCVTNQTEIWKCRYLRSEKKKRSKQGRERINPSQRRRTRDSSPGSHGQEGLRTITEFEMKMEIRRRVSHKATKMLPRQEKKRGKSNTMLPFISSRCSNKQYHNTRRYLSLALLNWILDLSLCSTASPTSPSLAQTLETRCHKLTWNNDELIAKARLKSWIPLACFSFILASPRW